MDSRRNRRDARRAAREAAEAAEQARRDYAQTPPGQRLGDAPVEAEIHRQMGEVMSAINEFINPPGGPKKWGVVVMMFPFEGFDGRCNYMSNGAAREDIVTLMREMIARFEGQPEVSGRA